MTDLFFTGYATAMADVLETTRDPEIVLRATAKAGMPIEEMAELADEVVMARLAVLRPA